MRSRPALLTAGLCLLAAAAYAPVAIARQTAPRPLEVAPQSAPAHASKDGYSSDERDFTVGRTVYLRSAKTKIGRIVAVEANHEFPATFRWWWHVTYADTSPHGRFSTAKRQAPAVLLRHVDGPVDWIPVSGLSRVYVVR